ncbi:glycosyltransferase [Sulfurimonas microaerophilic]|uniref:glycosyltransferase n=1 Tax=Sulfurimonas microaerophilic TaxID=3058392 RepID=UPI0027147FAD|nr:glycosyltransferase [Sulfurimonas sp. hsl 1-7]
MKVSIIIAVYKDTEALELIFRSLEYQTYKNFEVVVAEDGESIEMAKAVDIAQTKYDFSIVHTIQEDNGVRKSVSQNNAIRHSSGEYLIFIDGDCILYSNFIENHVILSAEKTVVSGRRVNLGPQYSNYLREKVLDPLELEKSFMFKYFSIQKDASIERHTEEGFSIHINGLIHTLMKKLRKKKFPLLGCNMSCYKAAMVDINGFDEALGNSAMAGDTDLEWRFEGLGYKIVSARFIANQFHLFHKRKASEYDRGQDLQMLENRKNKFFRCRIGLEKL